MTITAAPTVAITIGGVAPSALASLEVVEACFPESDVASIEIPLGRLRTVAGTIVADYLPAWVLDDAVVITSGAWTWYGVVTDLEEIGAPGQRMLRVSCVGAAGLSEAYCVPSWYVGGSLVERLPVLNPGGRGNRSGAVNGAGAFFVVAGLAAPSWTAYDVLDAACLVCTDSQAQWTLDAPGGILDHTDTWQLDGSPLAAVLDSCAARSRGYVSRIEEAAMVGGQRRATVRVRRRSSITGAALDLTDGRVQAYSAWKSSRRSASAVRAVGSDGIYAARFDHFTASGTGDLAADWDAADVAALEAGDDSSPAYRRFRIGSGINWPDGTNAQSCRLETVIPAYYTGAVVSGSRQTPAPVFARMRTPSNTWVAVQASVSPRDDGTPGVWIDGPDWPLVYQQADRLTVSLAFTSPKPKSYAVTGLSGRGVLRIPGNGRSVVINSGTAWGVTTGGGLITAGGTVGNTTAALQTAADQAAEDADVPEEGLRWSMGGVFAASPAPLSGISQATLATATGTRVITYAAGRRPVVTRRTSRWDGQSFATSWDTEIVNAPKPVARMPR